MDTTLYTAAMEGNANDLLLKRDQFQVQLTPNNNSVLHIAAQFGQTECINLILNSCSSLLCRVNIRDETPLHIAAKGGHCGIVRALIQECKRVPNGTPNGMLRMINKDGDTALHEATRNGSVEIVKMLIEEDPDFSHPLNEAKETPLYLAAERRHGKCVSEILKTCRSPCPNGPGGRTALHAAVIFCCYESMAKLLEWEDLRKQPDSSGWTPLHYAARLGKVDMVRKLVDSDKSLAYHAAVEDDKNTALHIATSLGHINVMGYLMSSCPDCCEMVNSRGQNILHIAVEKQKDSAIKFILKSRFIDILLNQKDNNGNTPLHLLAAARYYMPDLIQHPRVDKMAFNRDSLTPCDLVRRTEGFARQTSTFQLLARDFKKFGDEGKRNLTGEDKDNIERMNGYDDEWYTTAFKDVKKKFSLNLVVATIIATITFAAGFTLPGGFNQNEGPNQGRALLTGKVAFKAFVIADSIAVTCSSCVMFIYFCLGDVVEPKKLLRLSDSATALLISSAGMMMLAFTTGMYVVLGHSRGLAISVFAIGCSSFIIYYMVMKSVFAIYTPSSFRSFVAIVYDRWQGHWWAWR